MKRQIECQFAYQNDDSSVENADSSIENDNSSTENADFSMILQYKMTIIPLKNGNLAGPTGKSALDGNAKDLIDRLVQVRDFSGHFITFSSRLHHVFIAAGGSVEAARGA